MIGPDILPAAGLLMGFLLGVPAGVWLSDFAKKRGWK